jgi:hypothetical protein
MLSCEFREHLPFRAVVRAGVRARLFQMPSHLTNTHYFVTEVPAVPIWLLRGRAYARAGRDCCRGCADDGLL